jgi:hypothetical protein
MQHLGRNFNDLPAMPPHPNAKGIGRSGMVSGGAEGGSAASAFPMEHEGYSDSKVNPDNFIVQANLSARQAAAIEKRSLEASARESVPKRPHRSCTLRSGKSHLRLTHVV